MLLIALNGNAPRYVIERSVGVRELGIFAAMIYPMQAGTTVIAALGQSALPRLARFYASSDAGSFRALLFRMGGLALVVGCGGILIIWLAGEQILTVLYTREYAEHKAVFLLLGCSAALGYAGAILGYGMTAARYFRAQLPVFATVTLVTIVSSLIVIPRYGLTGAALVLIAAALIQCVGSILVIRHALGKFRHE
jgi:O-antigen/teichoic acid export membrane protein